MRKVILSGASLAAVVLGTAFIMSAQVITGGYRSIPTDDARAVAAGEFAVNKRSETNSEQEGLKLDSIDKAEIQVVAGSNYRLCMTVSLDGETQPVRAVIYQNLKAEYSLTSWTVVDTCGEGSMAAPGDTRMAANRSAGGQTARCTGDQLSLVEGEGDADMGGKRYLKFEFTNTSKRACTLQGFPTVVPLTRGGRVVTRAGVSYSQSFPVALENETGKRARTIRLAPGKKAYFQIYYNDGMAVDHKRPWPNVYKLRITAPHTTKSFTLKSEFAPCCGLEVSHIYKG